MTGIHIVEYGAEGLDLVEPLWKRFNEHHRTHSRYFSGKYESFTFSDRKQALFEKCEASGIHVALAVDTATGKGVGFCISSMTRYRDGEVEYLFIEEAYRMRGIGERLLKKAMRWLGASRAVIKKIAVEAGNEEVLPFYTRYGFLPRFIILEQAP
jgi:GNAT superfamily N-acetyltransferase